MSILQLQPTITDLELQPYAQSGDFSLNRAVWDADKLCRRKKCPHHGYIFVLLGCQSSISSVPLPSKKKTISRKSSTFIFKARAYCTFSGCNVSAMLLVKSCDVASDGVTIHVECSGHIYHTIGKKTCLLF